MKLVSNQVDLTSDSASDVSPVFSPNGQKIAFYSNRNGTWEIYTMNIPDSWHELDD